MVNFLDIGHNIYLQRAAFNKSIQPTAKAAADRNVIEPGRYYFAFQALSI
jgi:hypothetical protein